MASACTELFFENKYPNDETIRDKIYKVLADKHPEDVAKIERVTGGWKKYWNEVLSTSVSQLLILHIIDLFIIDRIIIVLIQRILQTRDEFRTKRANCVRNIKNSICNTFGKVKIGKIPGQKASVDEVLEWKTSQNVIWAKDNL